MTDDFSFDPVLDPERLEAVASLDLFSDEARTTLDAFARRAAAELHMPVGLVSIVLDTAQYLAGSHGLGGWLKETQGTPLEWSFCAHAVRSREDYIVENAPQDQRQQDNPLVTQDDLTSYAGTPLITSEGHILGSYCVLGDQPRSFSAEEMDRLRQMAAEVVEELETKRRERVAA